MSFDTLKKRVYEQNMEMVNQGLVILTWGNVSEVDREAGVMAIKPGGVRYSLMTPDDIVLVDLNDGGVVEGCLKPSSDTPTHLELYREFPEIGGITHTHSEYATAFAQACTPLPVFGTTHGDHFYGEIPCTDAMSKEEIEGEFEKNTGKSIVRTVKKNKITQQNPLYVPAVLVRQHGIFTWGKDSEEAVCNAIVAESLAKMAVNTLLINPQAESADVHLINKHFFRKHGGNAYYGQINNG